MPGVHGGTCQLGWGAANPITEGLEFISDSLRCYEEVANFSGIKGTRSRNTARSRITGRLVSGTQTFHPNPVSLDRILPRVLGAAEVVDVFALAETLPEFFVTSDRVTKVLTYSGCRVSRASFRAAGDGAPLEVAVDIIGKDEAVAAAGTFPAIVPDQTSAPYILSDLALTIGGSAFQCDGLEIVVDNLLAARRANSLTVTDIQPTDRLVTVSCRVPWGDAGTLYGTGAAGLAVVATFTNGATSTSFSMAAVRFPKSTPTVDDRGELWLDVTGQALMTGATRELVVTSDSTP